MWYKVLLNYLIAKVTDSKQKQAVKFLNVLLSELLALDGESIPALVLLGVIDKMYRKYNRAKPSSIELVDFARDLYILSIVHTKKCYDENIFIKSFDRINTVPEMKEILGFPNYSWKYLRKELRNLEFKILDDIDYSFEPDLDHILEILSTQNSDLIKSVVFEFRFLINKSRPFDLFIEKVASLCIDRPLQLVVEELEVKPVTLPRFGVRDQQVPHKDPKKEKIFISMAQFRLLSPYAFFESEVVKTIPVPPFCKAGMEKKYSHL